MSGPVPGPRPAGDPDPAPDLASAPDPAGADSTGPADPGRRPEPVAGRWDEYLAAAPAEAAPDEPKPQSRRGAGRRGVRTVLGAAILSAMLASASTLGVVALTSPWQPAASPGSTPAATPNAQLTSTVATAASDDTAAIARATASTVTIETQSTVSGGFLGGTAQASGVGSGIVLTADGLILTNNHVVEGASAITVVLPDGSTAQATVVSTDATHDLAVIRAKASGLSPATLTTSAVEIGQTVYAIGTPLGEYADSVTRGIVSATQRTVTMTDSATRSTKTLSGLIQTDAAINAGNSGGPLIDSQGRVVGIATAGSQSAEGIGFAIPISAASSLIAQAKASAA